MLRLIEWKRLRGILSRDPARSATQQVYFLESFIAVEMSQKNV